MLRRDVYPYEYMDGWERFNEISLLDKEAFNSKLNLKDCTDKDYAQYKEVVKKFELKNIGDYHNLYVQSNTLLLVDVFENFRDKCIEIWGLDPALSFLAQRLAWQACLKKTRVKLKLLTDYDMLWYSMIRSIRGGMCQGIHGYAKEDNKYMKNYDENIEPSNLMYLNANNLYG